MSKYPVPVPEPISILNVKRSYANHIGKIAIMALQLGYKLREGEGLDGGREGEEDLPR